MKAGTNGRKEGRKEAIKKKKEGRKEIGVGGEEGSHERRTEGINARKNDKTPTKTRKGTAQRQRK